MATNTTDARELRGALGQFATGVTVITTVDVDNSPVGVTASSFNSVSLDPPLVLWSLAKSARSMKAFEESGYFCVHVLGASQEELSARFATPGSDKFAGQKWTPGHGEVPLLPDFAARFQCKTTHMYEGGDHLIIVGEVLDYEKSDEPPLVFHGGRYALAKSKGQGEKPGAAVDIRHGTFTENFFLYLIARAHFQASAPLRKEYARANIDEDEYLALQNELLLNPKIGNVIQGTGGLCKVRVAAKGKGKRGGARVIYYHFVKYKRFYLLTLYTKNEVTDLTPGEKQQLKLFMESWKNEQA